MSGFFERLLGETFPEPEMPEAKKRVAIRNAKTGATRLVPVPGSKSLAADLMRGASRCLGPCGCDANLDGECQNGWPSRALRFGP